MIEPKENSIITPKTARYYTLGNTNEEVNELIIVLHGYAMLAKYFIKKFECIANNNRIIVAPEGLSKFYWKGMSGKVVASWMTKEDRLNEINDQVQFLDNVIKQLAEDLKTNEQTKITVLAFSQGVATGTRWLHYGKTKVSQLILWAGGPPMDVFEDTTSPVYQLPVTYVYGKQDPYISKSNVLAVSSALKNKGLDIKNMEFDGEHHIDEEVLLNLFK